MFIKDGGKTLIKIVDDGQGMDLDDLKKSILRHATSKITSEDDLYSIRTLGFRGEALASIVSVADVEITSKTRNSNVAYRLISKPQLNEGKLNTKINEVAAPVGTSIVVKNLFYNVPVRRKFLKSATVEQKHILDIVIQYSLCYVDVSFKVYNNRKLIFNTPRTDSLIKRVGDVYGPEISQNLLEVDFSNGIIKVSGVIGKPTLSKTEDYQSFYVNKRYIKSKLLSKAIIDAYKSMLFLSRKPVAILNLTIDPSKIDVNIHPTKQEIKFDNEEFVYLTLYNAVKKVLESSNLFPTKNKSNSSYRSYKSEQKLTNYNNSKNPYNQYDHILSNTNDYRSTIEQNNNRPASETEHFRKYNLKESTQSVLKEDMNLYDVNINSYHGSQSIDTSNKAINRGIINKSITPTNSDTLNNSTNLNSTNNANNPTNFEKSSEIHEPKSSPNQENWLDFSSILDEAHIVKVPFKKFRVLGQIDLTYIILETDRGMAIVDQHASHERINFEKIKRKFNETKPPKQALLNPKMISVHPKNNALLKENLGYFSELGFDIEPFQGNDFLVRSIPSFLQINDIGALIDEILGDIKNIKKDKEKLLRNKVLETMACHMSIRAGKELTIPEANSLIISLMKCERPFTCPHGRPTIIEFSSSDLEKMFNRKA